MLESHMAHPEELSVLFDISPIPYGRGVSRYTSNLVQALAARPEVKLILFGVSRGHYDELYDWAAQFGSDVSKHVWKFPPRGLQMLWRLAKLPRLDWIEPQADVFHAWDWQLAPIGKVPQVVTIHDLAYRLFPDTAHPDVVGQYDRLIATLERQTEIQVIAVSEATKKDIVNLTAIAPERVHVVYEALPEEARIVPAEAERASILARFGLHRPFLLAVGTTEPRKNLRRVIEAWKKVKDRFDLVIAGAAGWDTLEKAPGIHYLGYVAPEDLAGLYRSAHALVFVSLYEGFGLPILEAYFHECPVISANVSSMAEIAGPPAVLVDPYNVEMIAEACLAIEPPGTAARKQRVKDMRAVLEKFSWQRAAAETVSVYRLASRG
jgi:glycosyltransferase involved in cell wall biosynthesis